MKVDFNIISVPPYISTSWKNVDSLFLENDNSLVITLKNGTNVKIPALDKATIELIFNTHAKVLAKQDSTNPPAAIPPFIANDTQPLGGNFSNSFPLKIGPDGIEAMGAALSHNPDQANAPDLPIDMLKKIAMVAKIIASEVPENSFPKPENGCNCTHCQIARAIHKSIDPSFEEQEEEISEEDLKFKEWDITSLGNNIYVVIDLSTQEEFRVFLGEPLGCTCGEKNCVHIKAVLKS
jgi:hypothetical protein